MPSARGSLYISTRRPCYSLGDRFRNRYEGYCTEAGRALLQHALNDLGLHRVFARHFQRNPASGRVMQKLGMQYEGCLRQHVLKWGVYEDVNLYGILRSEWQAKNAGS